MKIKLSKKDVAYIKKVLKDVDKISYDPVYKTMIERIDSTSDKSKKEKCEFYLEEFEIFNVLEAFNNYSEMAKKIDDKEEMKKVEAITKLVNDITGISL